MRHIYKPAIAPAAIREYLENQIPVRHGLDYRTFSQTASPQGGSRAGQLCRELTAEQFGLCAYTGAGIDNRLGNVVDPNQRLRFRSHNEHLKPQSVCRQELMDAGRERGVDLGDDMNHLNIVAALEVSGDAIHVARADLFGATHRQNDPVSILPTDPRCEEAFQFNAQGHVTSSTDDGRDTIAQLNLNHRTIIGWRMQAISTFVEIIQSRSDALDVIDRTSNPTNGILPEYAFAIRSVAQSMLEIIEA